MLGVVERLVSNIDTGLVSSVTTLDPSSNPRSNSSPDELGLADLKARLELTMRETELTLGFSAQIL